VTEPGAAGTRDAGTRDAGAPGAEPAAPALDGALGPDLADLAWTPVSPRLVVARRLGLLWLVVPLAVALGVGLLVGVPTPWLVAAAALWLVLVASLWVLQGRAVRAIGYVERDDDLLVRRGVLYRSLVVVPYGRMQYVDVSAGPVDRWLGIATVQLHTASAGSDAAIPGLTPDDAARLRESLARRGEARLAGL
jgi:hypothetical protein